MRAFSNYFVINVMEIIEERYLRLYEIHFNWISLNVVVVVVAKRAKEMLIGVN